MIVLYKAIYKDRRLNKFAVSPVQDNSKMIFWGYTYQYLILDIAFIYSFHDFISFFFYSFARSFILSFHSFNSLLIYSFIYLFIHLIIHFYINDLFIQTKRFYLFLVPGKPVTSITWTSTSSQSITVSWSSSPSPQCGYVIFYRHNTSMNLHNMTANSTSLSTTITNLLPLAHYVIRIQSITVNGPGIPSDVISALTLEQGKHWYVENWWLATQIIEQLLVL